MTCHFFGGPIDGQIMPVQTHLLHCVRIPEPTFNAHWLEDDIPLPSAVHRVTEYYWDWSISDAGHRRMRWSGRFT